MVFINSFVGAAVDEMLLLLKEAAAAATHVYVPRLESRSEINVSLGMFSG